MAIKINTITIKDAESKEFAKRLSSEFKKQVKEVENSTWQARALKTSTSNFGRADRYFFKFSNNDELGMQGFIISVAFGAGIFITDKTVADQSTYAVNSETRDAYYAKNLPSNCSEVLLITNFPHSIIQRVAKDLLKYAPVEFIDKGPKAKRILNTTEPPEEAEGRVKLHTTLARLDQGKFSEKIRNQYNHACVITGCNVRAALQAAHIKPFSEDRDDAPENGLLLRADLHLLFDRGLMAIDPATGKVHFKNTGEHYNKYDQKIVDISKASQINLTAHWQKFQTT